MESIRAAAAEHWNRWQKARDTIQSQYIDWGDHPTIAARIQTELFGSPTVTVFDYLKSEYPEFATASVLSLCAGDGSFEKLLLLHGIFGSITGMDIAAERVAAGNNAADAFAGRLRFAVGDVNSGEFGDAQYDVVFAKAALHHVEQLEKMFAGAQRCLKPGGKLVTIDFFGPTRFQWTDAQLAAVNHFIDTTIPDDLLRRADGSLQKHITRPTIAEMIAMDPSEAVRSSEVRSLLDKHFTVEKELAVGGTLLNLVFGEAIINNFDVDNARHVQIINAAFDYERELMNERVIGSDFRFIVAGLGSSSKPILGSSCQ